MSAGGQAQTVSGSDTIEVGDAGEVDMDAIRAVIDRTQGDLGPLGTLPPGAQELGLEDAIRIALVNNLDLQIVALQRDAVEHEVPATKAKFDPTPGVNFLYTDERIDNPLGEDDEGNLVKESGRDKSDSWLTQAFVRQELPTGGTVTLSTDALRESGDSLGGNHAYEGGGQIELRQPLMRGGRIYVATREIKDAEFNLGVAQSQLQAEILRVTADVKQAYYNTIFSARVIQVSQEAIERSRLLVEASEALFGAGRANQRDVVSAQIRLSDDLSDLVRRQALLERAQLVLRDVTGLPIREPLALASDTIPFYPIKIHQGEWIERAIANRPEIQGVLYRLDQSALNVRVASNSVLPKLDVVGLFRRSDFDRSYQNVWGFDSQRFIGGLEFEIPFGNVAARERLRSAKIVHQRVERELVNTRRLIELEVRGEVISLRENLEDLEAQTAKVQQARQKLEIATVRYQRGLANNLDITDAQEDLVDAETDFLANIVDYTNGLARLEARIAGPL